MCAPRLASLLASLLASRLASLLASRLASRLALHVFRLWRSPETIPGAAILHEELVKHFTSLIDVSPKDVSLKDVACLGHPR